MLFLSTYTFIIIVDKHIVNIIDNVFIYTAKRTKESEAQTKGKVNHATFLTLYIDVGPIRVVLSAECYENTAICKWRES